MKGLGNMSKSNLKQIIVVGTSAGGMNALALLFEQLPKDFAAPILIVMHISADAVGNALLDKLNNIGKIKCVHAETGMTPEPGYAYLAPSDHHLMIDKNGNMITTKGAQENRARPSIDPLFRSAAVVFGNRVTGIILSGYLDDGTSGLLAIQKCGGTTVIQDPADAEYPDMPSNALNQLDPDYCVPIIEMGSILSLLMERQLGKGKQIPEEIRKEAVIAERVVSDLSVVNDLGDQVPFNCPGCGGILWKINKGSTLRFRCHVGHAYTAAVLLAEQTRKIEETMWTALRMFEERRNLLTTMSKQPKGAVARSAAERARISQVHIDRIRSILLSDDKGTQKDVPH
jgi:two-component system chemotaxis response regulator CheB